MIHLHKNHKTELWNYLQANPGWHTSNELAVVIGVSKRSIMRYAKDLIDTSAIFVSDMGYKVNQDKLDSSSDNIVLNNTSYDGIKRVLVNEFTQKKVLNIYDLTGSFYLSESVLLKLMQEVQRYFENFDLEFSHSGAQWSLHGSEINKRRVISDILYKESEQSSVSSKIIQDSLPNINVSQLIEIIQKEVRSEKIYLNVFDFNNILLHIAVATHRTKNGYQVQNNYQKNQTNIVHNKTKVKNVQSLKFANKLIDQIEITEKVRFSDEERTSLILIVQFSITRKHRNLEDNVSHNTVILVDDLIQYVNSMLNIDLRVLNFREQFAIHIQRLLKRSSYGYVERNPMTLRIRQSSPIIYECAVLISNRLEKHKGILIEDDEIAYIAMHIGNAVSEYINDLHKLYVIVLIPNYQNDDDNFVSRLERLFSQDMVIGGVVHAPDKLKNDDYPRPIDFVIQVNSVNVLPNLKYTNISQFLTQLDYFKISRLIRDLKHRQEKNNFINNLKIFFPSENFKFIKDYETRDNLFRSICNELENKHVIKKNFVEQLEEREKVSSTAFGRVAIPHSLQMDALKTQGYIALSPKGIKWGDNENEVNLVFLLAVNKNNKSSYRNIFDDLSQIAVDPKNIVLLIHTKTYKEFIDKLASLL